MNNLIPQLQGLSNPLELKRVTVPLYQRPGESEQDDSSRILAQVRVRTGQGHSGEITQGQVFITVLLAYEGSPQNPAGLTSSLIGRGGISAYLPKQSGITQHTLNRPTMYRKNGILVAHIGRTITSEDVARALEEE